jgi:tetrathionate reductase subunit B
LRRSCPITADHRRKQRERFVSRRRSVTTTALAGVGAGVALAEEKAQVVGKATKSKCYGMVIDLRRCVGCHTCTVACKSEFSTPLGVWRAWVKIEEHGTYTNMRRSFLPKLCNNCRDAPCVSVCPTGASHYDRDDTVQISDKECIGCKLCIAACPYKQRFVNPDKSGADKCSFCMHRVRKGLVPSCVNTCVGRARIFGDFNDPESEVSKLIRANKFKVLKPELGTKPQVYYIGHIED